MLPYALMRAAQMFVIELALRHREVVHLVIRAAYQQPDIAEPADMLDLFGISCGDR